MIENYISSAPLRTPEGYPADPPPLPDPPTTVATPADSLQDLTIVPTVPTSTNCYGIYHAGERFVASGDGFKAGAIVQVYISSPGVGLFGLAQEQLLTQLTANSQGQISTTIAVPDGATGFVENGSSSGIAFIDAIGLGPGGTHADDVQMLGIAPRG